MGKRLSKQKLNKRQDWHLVAETQTLELYRRPSKTEWGSFYLRTKAKPSGGIKSTWWFGCNGERFTRCEDIRLLRKNYPEVVKWLEDNLL